MLWFTRSPCPSSPQPTTIHKDCFSFFSSRVASSKLIRPRNGFYGFVLCSSLHLWRWKISFVIANMENRDEWKPSTPCVGRRLKIKSVQEFLPPRPVWEIPWKIVDAPLDVRLDHSPAGIIVRQTYYCCCARSMNAHLCLIRNSSHVSPAEIVCRQIMDISMISISSRKVFFSEKLFIVFLAPASRDLNANASRHSFYCQPFIKHFKRVWWANSNSLPISIATYCFHVQHSFFTQIQNTYLNRHKLPFTFWDRWLRSRWVQVMSHVTHVMSTPIEHCVNRNSTPVAFVALPQFSSAGVFLYARLFLLFHFSRRSDFARNGSLCKPIVFKLLIKVYFVISRKIKLQLENHIIKSLITWVCVTVFTSLWRSEEIKKVSLQRFWKLATMSVILKIDPSKKDIIINNNHNGITINNNNVPKREFPVTCSVQRVI